VPKDFGDSIQGNDKYKKYSFSKKDNSLFVGYNLFFIKKKRNFLFFLPPIHKKAPGRAQNSLTESLL